MLSSRVIQAIKPILNNLRNSKFKKQGKYIHLLKTVLIDRIISSGFFVRFAGIILKKKANKTKNIKSLLTLISSIFNIFPFRPWRIYMNQLDEEILELLKILAKSQPRSILEIGSAQGATLFLFSRVISQKALIISVDLPGGPFGGGYPSWRIPYYKSFPLKEQKIVLIRKNSHENSTLVKIKKLLNERPIDFLFIDGDHTYEGVKKDFEIYSSLVRNGGIIAFHDINPISKNPQSQTTNVSSLNLGVDRFWKEIKNNYKNLEICKEKNQNGYGIGILFI